MSSAPHVRLSFDHALLGYACQAAQRSGSLPIVPDAFTAGALMLSAAFTDHRRMSIDDAVAARIAFDEPRLQARLDRFRDDPAAYDSLDFGLIAMDLDGVVVAYNRVESEYAGLSANDIMGLTFFTDVAPCTNNYLVSGRFDDETTLDDTIDYVFTLKMRPTPVKLRLLKDEHARRQYLLVKR